MSTTKQSSPLPKEQVFTVFLVQFCEGNNINVLFPFLAFMVEYFGYTGHELGYHAGALAGTFCAAQFFSSVPWGTFSDKYGRKPGIFFGVLGAGVGMLILGFAKNYYQAILGRAISGFLSGNTGVIKSFLTEITDDSNRGKGFTYMQLGWSIGTICGPLAGGLLCYPANKFPTYFSQDGIFGQHPFLLPCLFCASINLFTAIYSFFFMKESRKWQNDNNNSSNSSNSISIISSISSSNSSSYKHKQLSQNEDNEDDIEESISLWNDDMDNSIHGSEIDNHEEEKPSILKGILPSLSFSTSTASLTSSISSSSSQGYSQLTTIESNISDMNESIDTELTDNSTFLPLASDETSIDRLNNTNDDDSNSIDSNSNNSNKNNNKNNNNNSDNSDSNSNSKNKNNKNNNSSDDKLLNYQSILAVLCYGLCCMAFIVMDESLPLLLKLDTSLGGFSFTSTQIGSLLSVGGIAMLLWSMLFLPYVSNSSKLQLFKTCSLIGAPIALSYPVLVSLRPQILSLFGEKIGEKIIFGCLLISVTARNSVSTTVFMAVIILVNHSAYDYQLGALNGIGQTVAAAARSVGPALGGVLWSISTRLHFLYINFLLSMSIFLLMNYVAQKLPASIDFAKVKKDQKHNNNNNNNDKLEHTEIEMIQH